MNAPEPCPCPPETATAAEPARSFLIAGHSHLISFPMSQNWAQRGQMKAVAMPDHEHVRILVGAWPRTVDYWEQALAAASHTTVAISWKGNQHNVGFMFAHKPEVDFECAGFPSAGTGPGVLVVPELSLRSYFAPSFSGLRHLLNRVRQHGLGSNLVLLGTPPPIGHNEVIRQRLLADPFFRQRAQENGMTLAHVRLSSPLLRLKLWNLLQRMTEELASEFGCHFCPSPPAAVDPNGFLRPKYWGTDATHVNGEFGRAMVRDLEQMFVSTP